MHFLNHKFLLTPRLQAGGKSQRKVKRLLLPSPGVTCLKAGVNEKRLALDHVIRQFICVSHRLRKMPSQYAPDFLDRF